MRTEELALQRQNNTPLFVHDMHPAAAVTHCKYPVHQVTVSALLPQCSLTAEPEDDAREFDVQWMIRVLPELGCTSTVNNTVDLGAARVDIGLQDENNVVWDAETLADNLQSVMAAVLIDRDAHNGLGSSRVFTFARHTQVRE